jgi:hypothetical protein
VKIIGFSVMAKCEAPIAAKLALDPQITSSTRLRSTSASRAVDLRIRSRQWSQQMVIDASRKVPTVLVATILLGGCLTQPDTAPPPIAVTPPPPQVQQSVIQVPFQTANLQQIANLVNDPAVVPTGQNGEGAWGDVGHDGLWDKVSWSRGNFTVTASNNAIDLTTTVQYQVQLSHLVGHAHVPLVQCGHGEPEASFSVGVHTTITPNSDWSFTVNPTLIGPTTVTPCHLGGIGPLTYDASGKIAGLVHNLLSGKLDDIKNSINAELQFKDKAATAWQELQTPANLGNDAYFVATLSGVNLAPLSANNNQVSLVGGISGTAQVIIGAAVTPTPTPLPPLQIVNKPTGFYVELPVTVSYDDIGKQLNQLLSGRQYPFAGNTVTIDAVSVYGTSDALVLQMDLTLTGAGGVRIYLTGTPAYDPLRNIVSANNLQYTASTQSMLIKIADWLLHSEFLSIMQSEAHYDISAQVAALRTKATAAINRSLNPHADLAGSVTNITLLGFALSPDAATAYLDANGNATVTLH